MLNIKFNKENGGVDFFSDSDDAHKMNWVDGEATCNDRGDFVLHPCPCIIPPGDKMCIEWEMFFYPDGEFEKSIEKYKNVLLFDTDNYAYFTDEKNNILRKS